MRARCAGSAGFQLINVNAVPLALGGWSTSTQLASRKALAASLIRHYRDECIKEAHKARSPCPAPTPLTGYRLSYNSFRRPVEYLLCPDAVSSGLAQKHEEEI